MKSRILNIIAPRCKLAMSNFTRNQTPKLMPIKTAAKIFKGNWQTVAKNKEVVEISPSIVVFVHKESETNTLSFLPQRAKKLDGEETRTILLHRRKSILSS